MEGGRVGAATTAAPLESRPGIFLVGSPNVGKRTLLSRLLSIDFSDAPDSWTGVLCHGWTIDTKYYSADLSIWTAQLDDEFCLGALPVANQLAALVMVFDLNDLSSFAVLKDWVLDIDIQRFEILFCIGNKADLLPGHFAHVEYRRRLQKRGESLSDPEFLDYGILETEGSSLLGEEVPSWEIRKSCLEWCSQYNIEYIEACASNADFDKCLSADGDMQGVERLFGALSAHMWPGMILKSGDKITEPSLVEKEVLAAEKSDEESDYEFEYERLSGGSDELWDGAGGSWVSFCDHTVAASMGECSANEDVQTMNTQDLKKEIVDGDNDQTSTSGATLGVTTLVPNPLPAENSIEEKLDNENSLVGDPDQEHEEDETSKVQTSTSKTDVQEDPDNEVANADEFREDMQFRLEDLEHLMSEIGSIRDNLRLMPDFQRREIAAKLAMKMATMFGEKSNDDDEDGHE